MASGIGARLIPVESLAGRQKSTNFKICYWAKLAIFDSLNFIKVVFQGTYFGSHIFSGNPYYFVLP